ncbi:MAG: DUF1667 domain-containing protein [Lachnospiraceae bacterium]|nr:DUF1667 domain-containing protein [Lachnospiraceae bacterium]
MLKEFVCIMCPQGCSLEVEMEEGQVKEVRGNTCPKGEQYALQEALSPMRNIATSVLVDGGELPLASVRLSAPIPKEDIFRAMEEIRKVHVAAPVTIGQKVIENILGTGSDVVITKNVGRKS